MLPIYKKLGAPHKKLGAPDDIYCLTDWDAAYIGPILILAHFEAHGVLYKLKCNTVKTLVYYKSSNVDKNGI